MIRPLTRNICVTQGTTYDDAFTRYTGATVVDGVVTAPGTLKDFTGCRVGMEVRSWDGTTLGPVALDFDSAAVVPGAYQETVVHGGVLGTVRFSADLQRLPVGRYYHSYFEQSPAGVKVCIYKGEFRVAKMEIN